MNFNLTICENSAAFKQVCDVFFELGQPAKTRIAIKEVNGVYQPTLTDKPRCIHWFISLFYKPKHLRIQSVANYIFTFFTVNAAYVKKNAGTMGELALHFASQTEISAKLHAAFKNVLEAPGPAQPAGPAPAADPERLITVQCKDNEEITFDLCKSSKKSSIPTQVSQKKTGGFRLLSNEIHPHSAGSASK